ncbi:MAG: SHOCT domain-containing protein [Pirellulaceae bacterium]|nr:SHOCT domain-containing protein [Pirellulaceae bacterium]
MPTLSPSGDQLVQTLARRYGLSTDAVTHMLIAVHNGNGTMAQFGHPEFCGSGQWMRGGMTMVSDLFNNNLKCLVDNLCNDISNELANNQSTPFGGSFQSQSQGGMSSQAQASGQMGSQNSLFVPDPKANWWPPELGTPSSLGSQNSLRYAYFADAHRLAVTTGGTPWIYDTLDHQISGFGQQQGGGQSITFTSQYGTVDLATLPVVSRDGHVVSQPNASLTTGPSNPPAPAPTVTPQNVPETQSDLLTKPTPAADPNENVITTLERLGALKEKGYITDEEFASKKNELLNRL